MEISNLEVNNKRFRIRLVIKIRDCFIGEIHEGKEASKEIGNYGGVLEFLDISLAFFRQECQCNRCIIYIIIGLFFEIAIIFMSLLSLLRSGFVK